MRLLVPTLALASVLLGGGHGWSADLGRSGAIRVEEAWARQAPLLVPAGRESAGTGNAALYVTLRNMGSEAETLLAVASPAADRAELHEVLQDGPVMRMRAVASREVPAHGVLPMQPGGLHIMLINLRQALRPGDGVPVTLTFARAAPLTLVVPVR